MLIGVSTLAYFAGLIGAGSGIYIDNPGLDGVTGQNVTSDLPSGDIGLFSSFSLRGWFRTIFSVFVFDLDMIGDSSLIGSYFWVIRIILIWLPGIFTVIALYFSLPTVSS